MAEFVVYGIDVIDNPSVNTNSTAGNDGQGTATVSGGSQPFEDDDIIVFSAINTNAAGEITPSSAITGLTVYDSLEDYEAGTVKYTYTPMNPGQTATVQGDVSGLGDGYVSFNANVLVSSDGGPSINRLFIAPGTDLADASQQPGGLTLNRNQDIDLNGDGDTDDPGEAGDNYFYAGDYTASPTCFTPGARILTPRGEVAIEDLQVGDLVLTADNGAQPIRWIGRRRVPALGHLAPVTIAPGTFGDHGAVTVSQNHRVMRDGAAIELLFGDAEVLVAAKHLVDRRNVTLRQGGTVDYIHLLFDDHQLIWANGLLSESLLPGCDDEDPARDAGSAEIIALFPDAPRGRSAARRCLTRFEAVLLKA